jgi:aminopeptidase N
MKSFFWNFLAGMLLFNVSAFGQFAQQPAFCNHLHPCEHNRTKSLSIGIYDQDERVHHYDVKFYGLDINVKPWTTQLDGSVRIIAEIVHPQTRYIVLEMIDDLSVVNVLHNQQSLPVQQTPETVIIDFGSEMGEGTLIDFEVFYGGKPTPEGFFAGIQTKKNSLGDDVLWTLSEPHNARQWFPCKQVLEDKADSIFVAITTPDGFMAASNGLLQDKIVLEDGRIRHEWKSHYPTAFYLISMAVANYQEYNFYAPLADENDSVFVQNFIYNHDQGLARKKSDIDRTKPMMQLMSQLWGDYPFAAEKYGHAEAPMGGGMEHQTISTMGYFGFDIVAHELAHHWFGNYVTCATWSDIWINEGFASYAEFLAREFVISGESAQQWMDAIHGNVKSQPGGSVYVPVVQLNDVWRIFNGRLSYHKGAAILHQLRFEINDDELFFFIMEDFLRVFADDVASGDDFRQMVELHTEKSWEWFFDQWYYGEGYPIYELKWWQQGNKLVIRSAQKTSAATPSFFAGTLEFKVKTNGSEQIIRVFQDDVLQDFEFEIEETVESILFDPLKFMLKDFTISQSTGVDSIDVELFQIFPNPFADQVTINYPGNWSNGYFMVFDLGGRVLLEEKMGNLRHTKNLATLDPGIYLIGIVSPMGEKKTFRVMKYP